MRHKMMTAAILTASLFTFAAGAVLAQRTDTQFPQAQTAPQTQPGQRGMMGGGTAGGNMMGGGMMNQAMGQMMNHHQQMTGLMTKLMASMDAIEKEKDPAALKQKIADHRALLEQMRGQMTQQGNMMQNMSPMMGNTTTPATK